MSNFFYYDRKNRKQGPVTSAQLKALVGLGIITPQTPLETDTGKKGLAGQVRGLFPSQTEPLTKTLTEPQSSDCATPTQSKDCGSKVPRWQNKTLWIVAASVVALLFVCVIGWTMSGGRQTADGGQQQEQHQPAPTEQQPVAIARVYPPHPC